MNIHYTYDMSEFNFNTVHEWLSKTYWSTGIDKDKMIRGFRNSCVVVGAFTEQKQIGVGRCISDTTRIGYIADIFVDPQFRRQGIAQRMVDEIINHPKIKDVESIYLITKDAHSLYEKKGFKIYDSPQNFMAKKYND